MLIYIPIDWFGNGFLKTNFIYAIYFETGDEMKITLAIMKFVYCFVWILIAISTGEFCIVFLTIYITEYYAMFDTMYYNT